MKKMIDKYVIWEYNFGMTIIYNCEKLEALLNDLSSLTGATLSFWDADHNLVAHSDAPCGYCARVRENPNYYGECKISDSAHFAEAAACGDTVFYTCHAGITETVTPFVYDTTVIGYLIIGRFRDKEERYSTTDIVIQRITNYGLCTAEMLDLYRELPVLSSKDLQTVIRLFGLCLRGIWHEGLIRIDKDVLMMRIESYLEEHLRDKITLGDICRTFSISKHALYRLFDKNFHTTVNDHITALRISKAKKLLINTDMSMTEIAEETGFGDYNYFIRVFKKHTLTSPHKYRGKMRG